MSDLTGRLQEVSERTFDVMERVSAIAPRHRLTKSDARLIDEIDKLWRAIDEFERDYEDEAAEEERQARQYAREHRLGSFELLGRQ